MKLRDLDNLVDNNGLIELPSTQTAPQVVAQEGKELTTLKGQQKDVADLYISGMPFKKICIVTGLTQDEITDILRNADVCAYVTEQETAKAFGDKARNEGWDSIEEKVIKQLNDFLLYSPDPETTIKIAKIALLNKQIKLREQLAVEQKEVIEPRNITANFILSQEFNQAVMNMTEEQQRYQIKLQQDAVADKKLSSVATIDVVDNLLGSAEAKKPQDNYKDVAFDEYEQLVSPDEEQGDV